MQHIWKILQLKRTIENDIITKVEYQCSSNHENINTRKIGSFEVSGDINDEGFIPYDLLTKNDVLGWLTDNVIKSDIEAMNSASINATIIRNNAVTTAEGIPWDN